MLIEINGKNCFEWIKYDFTTWYYNSGNIYEKNFTSLLYIIPIFIQQMFFVFGGEHDSRRLVLFFRRDFDFDNESISKKKMIIFWILVVAFIIISLTFFLVKLITHLKEYKLLVG